MLKREISEKLKLWRTQKNKKALCIIGARKIGKCICPVNKKRWILIELF